MYIYSYINISIISDSILNLAAKRAAHLCHLVVIHAQDVLHQVIGLADQLHVAVLDAVVDHFHKVPRAFISDLRTITRRLISKPNSDSHDTNHKKTHPVTAGFSCSDFGCDALKDVFNVWPWKDSQETTR